jgi:hypothetical protein
MTMYATNSQRFDKENSSQRLASGEGDVAAPGPSGAVTSQGQNSANAVGMTAPRSQRVGLKRSAEAAGLYWTPLGKL